MSLKILQWNIKGYVNNYSELLILIKEHKPHIITIQETHIIDNNNLPIPINYKLITCPASNRFGGAGILIHKSIQYFEINHTNDLETVAIEVNSKQKLSIFSTYIPPSKSFTSRNLENIFTNHNTPSIITGDFNSWHANWGSPQNNKRGNILAKFIEQSRYIILNDKSPTHYTTHNTFTHIDISFCSPQIAPLAEWNILNDLCGSDHFPIIVSLFPNPKIENISRPYFITNKADWESFSTTTDIFNDKFPINNSVNKEAATINKIILISAHKNIPQTSPNKFNHKVPWWNTTLNELRLKKNKAWRILKRHINSENIINYKRANAIFRRQLKISKTESTKEFTSTINPSTPTAKTWANIRRFCGLNPVKNIHCLHNPFNNETTTSYNTMANIFVNYWSQLSDDNNFSSNFLTNKYNIPNTNFSVSKSAQFIEKNITLIELQASLQSLKGSTPGLNRISYPMIKNCSHTMQERIVRHFNNIFNNFIPQSYKTSLVIPIHKPNLDKMQVSSYRPISLNCCLSKTLDKIIARRIWWYVTQNKFLHPNQFGFKRGKSVAESLLYADFLITKSLASKKHTSLITLDFSKAFDRVGIHTIINQLSEWKLGPKIIKYVQNFMSNRKLAVRMGSQTSNILPLHNGIPQGSPISVILFLIAYNKLSKIISMQKEIKFSAYADDFFLIINFNKSNNINYNLDKLFQNIEKWCSYSGAVLSLSKCQHLHICRKHNCNCKISCNNIQIPSVSSVKILGLTINKNYTWLSHINMLRSSLSKSLNIIKCLASKRFNCNTHTLITITKAILISKIDYALFIYGYSPTSILNKIKTPFNAAIRMSLGAFRSTPINNMLFEANIPSIELKRNLTTAKLSKSLLNSSDTPLANIIKHCKISSNKKIKSSIERSILILKSDNLPYLPQKITFLQPPWLFPQYSINTSLRIHNKQITPPHIYRQHFSRLKNEYNNHTFIYTDGSRQNNVTGYAITTEAHTLKYGNLPYYSSVLSAEIIAILEALNFVKSSKGSFVICSDSLSALDSISNINNTDYYASLIRSLLTTLLHRVTIIWIPGHVAITGNELADHMAKASTLMPLIYTHNYNTKDFNRYFKNQLATKLKNKITSCNEWYRNLNQNLIHINDYLNRISHNNITRLDQIKIIRLRLGHTKITHQHYIDQNISSLCTLCNSNNNINVKHILNFCPSLTAIKREIFEQDNPLDILANPSEENMLKIIRFLKKSQLYNVI